MLEGLHVINEKINVMKCQSDTLEAKADGTIAVVMQTSQTVGEIKENVGEIKDVATATFGVVRDVSVKQKEDIEERKAILRESLQQHVIDKYTFDQRVAFFSGTSPTPVWFSAEDVNERIKQERARLLEEVRAQAEIEFNARITKAMANLETQLAQKIAKLDTYLAQEQAKLDGNRAWIVSNAKSEAAAEMGAKIAELRVKPESMMSTADTFETAPSITDTFETAPSLSKIKEDYNLCDGTTMTLFKDAVMVAWLDADWNICSDCNTYERADIIENFKHRRQLPNTKMIVPEQYWLLPNVAMNANVANFVEQNRGQYGKDMDITSYINQRPPPPPPPA